MLDGPLPAAVAKPLDYDQMVFLDQQGYVPWELLVDLFVDDRIGIAGNELVITTDDLAEVLPFHYSVPRCWNAEIGSDQITFRTSLDAVRAVAA